MSEFSGWNKCTGGHIYVGLAHAETLMALVLDKSLFPNSIIGARDNGAVSGSWYGKIEL